jgi:hypothetical protein
MSMGVLSDSHKTFNKIYLNKIDRYLRKTESEKNMLNKEVRTVRELIQFVKELEMNMPEYELDSPVIICNDSAEVFEFICHMTQGINGSLSITLDPECDLYGYDEWPEDAWKQYKKEMEHKKFIKNRDMRIALAQGE